MIIHNGEHIRSPRANSRLTSLQHGASTSTCHCPPSSLSLLEPATSSTLLWPPRFLAALKWHSSALSALYSVRTLPSLPSGISISDVFSDYSSTTPAAETLEYGPEIAIGLGYGESKWVTEQLLGRVSADSGLRTTVARVGQLCGDTRVGGWGTKEWVPAIARASLKVGCAPMKDDVRVM